MRGTGRAGELCERFELDASGRIRRMSKGMKQKVAIVCALMHDPAVLILDEPTSGLDPLMQNRFIDLILEEKQRAGVPLRLEDILADYSGWEEMFRKIAYKEEYL